MNNKNALMATLAAATLTAFGCASQAESTESDGSEQSAKAQTVTKLRGFLNANTGNAKLQPQSVSWGELSDIDQVEELSDIDYPVIGGEPMVSNEAQSAADSRNHLNANTGGAKLRPQGFEWNSTGEKSE